MLASGVLADSVLLMARLRAECRLATARKKIKRPSSVVQRYLVRRRLASLLNMASAIAKKNGQIVPSIMPAPENALY